MDTRNEILTNVLAVMSSIITEWHWIGYSQFWYQS